MLSRRSFLQSSAIVSLTPLLPAIVARTARAAGAAPDARALVVIQLDGGNDGINTVVPYADDNYAKARVRLRLEMEKLHKLNDYAALHPNMKGAKELFDDGRLAIVQGVSYPNPNRSHFESMKIWQTANREADLTGGDGWLGRALDRQIAADAQHKPKHSIYVGAQETPVALWGRQSEAVAMTREDDLELQLKIGVAMFTDGSAGVGNPGADRAVDQFVVREVLSAYDAARQFQERRARAPAETGATYPDTQLATQLRLVSQLLKADSPARVYYAMQTGYDTHSSQLDTHSQLLRELSEAMKTFLNDLKSAQLDDRVVVLAFSEFGRRVAENDSAGTDHGTAGPVFLAGTPVRGGLIGGPPMLADLQEGDLKSQHDFRQVYATLLDNWLGVSSKEVLGAAFEHLPILNA